jgi:hypothetical protein
MILMTVKEGESIASVCKGGFIPDQEMVSNFCKNIAITSKMEKEVTIICLIYMERLLVKSGFGLDIRNWRKITLIALVWGYRNFMDIDIGIEDLGR